MAIVLHLIGHTVVGAMLIVQASITWLKFVSYVHANCNYRATLVLVGDLDAGGGRPRHTLAM